MNRQSSDSRIHISIDLEQQGRQVGDLLLKWSDNRQPLGHYPIPIICLAHGKGPTLLLTGGVHGDEFEGPVALMRLLQTLSVDQLEGRVIILPALNAPALMASSRISPLDQINLNRAFPGHADGTPTSMLAHFIEEVLMPQCDAVIDLHSGGKAAVFASCALAQVDSSVATGDENMALARAYGAPYIWCASKQNDSRSVNAAALRKAVPMIAAELGGGGGCDPDLTNFAERALRRCLAHLGITRDSIAVENENPVLVEFSETGQNFTAPAAGLFDRYFAIGDEVRVDQSAGCLHFIDEPGRASMELRFPRSGIVFAYGNRGLVERGETLALIAQTR